MRILVTGSRDWTDERAVARALDSAARPGELIIVVHGGARGADLLAEEHARERGWVVEEHQADWAALGNSAGCVRNQEMVDTGPDVCLAFIKPCRKAGCGKPKPHDSHGVSDCMKRARAANITTEEYR